MSISYQSFVYRNAHGDLPYGTPSTDGLNPPANNWRFRMTREYYIFTSYLPTLIPPYSHKWAHSTLRTPSFIIHHSFLLDYYLLNILSIYLFVWI